MMLAFHLAFDRCLEHRHILEKVKALDAERAKKGGLWHRAGGPPKKTGASSARNNQRRS
jgi:hypothetical protein